MKSKAFTLIELLVVIAIMTILIGLSAFGLQQAREASRDGQRKSDLETIRTGLVMYKSDCNAYPTNSGDFKTIFGSTFIGDPASCGGTSNTYIAKVPSDPVPGNNYHYSSTDGITYRICASLETEDQTVISDCSGFTCGGPCNYTVTNP